jgi:hypothetical protein
MAEINEVYVQLKAYQTIRNEFYNYLDNKISKNKFDIFDFSDNPMLDGKEVYDLFHKLDYQARKLRALLMEAHDIDPV